MEAVFNTMSQVTLSDLAIGSSCWVDITYINNPHSFYVRPRVYSRYLPYIQSPGKRPKVGEVNLGDVVIFRSRTVKNDVRGKVLCKEGGTEPLFNLFALDYGCVESVPLQCIWKLHHAADDLPSMVTHCQLADCAPRGDAWDRRAIDAMKNYVEGERAKLIVRNKTIDAFVVELYNSCPDDIATLLALTGYTTFGYAQDTPSGSRADDQSPAPTFEIYPARQLNPQSVLHVRMLNGSIHDLFYVVEVEQYNAYLEDRKELCPSKCPKMSYPDDLKPDAPIGVYYEQTDNYERGIIKDIITQKQKVKVYLIDWGIEIVVHVNKTIHVPDWYLHIPPRALLCAPYYKQLLTINLNQYSHAGVEFLMRIESVGGGDSPHIVVILPLE